jgi:hypothetical protein
MRAGRTSSLPWALTCGPTSALYACRPHIVAPMESSGCTSEPRDIINVPCVKELKFQMSPKSLKNLNPESRITLNSLNFKGARKPWKAKSL